MKDLRERLRDGHVHIIDGAMGTMLYQRGFFVNVCYDELNLSRPELVRGVHEAYLRAGAEILETNTFGSNPVKLSSHGLEDRTEEINRVAAGLARQAAGDLAFVLGSVGPLGTRIEPWGPTSRDEATAYFARQITGLLEGDVDGFILETFADVDELQAAVNAARALSNLPVVAQMSFGVEGSSAYGTPVELFAERMAAFDVDVIGLNCAVGPAPMLETIERLAAVTDRPISALPNAGLPRSVAGRIMYLSSPEYMGRYARRMIEAGVRIIGGCCGTTPAHIREIRSQVVSMVPRRTAAPRSPAASRVEAHEPLPLVERSRLGAKLSGGQFVIATEVLPPRGWKPDEMLARCRELRDAGVDVVHVLDTPLAKSRMGVVSAAGLIEREVGVETVFHYTCRDRNMLGMQADLLGAAAAGLRNVLAVTGDPPASGAYPDSAAVFDIDSIGLTNLVHRLNCGLDPGGNSIGDPTRFAVGVALSQSARDIEAELRRFYWKVDAGADFAVTHPVFDAGGLQRLLDRLDHEQLRIPVIAGLWPLVSVRSAEYLANELPDVVIPDEVLGRMRAAEDRSPEAARAEGVAIALEVYEAIRDSVQGVQVATPLRGRASTLEVLAAVRADNPG
ncbi:MAG: bifunctional homocysteine S-methyltransferase/methylenetetrahydrofolate reductase [Candidatus Palauibacterales bacterium]|nr:bifunctional homocysteine S-methyltransferase/methylenetetrahydrofolate reductase [Candidatus Palauibacterales bacterium]